MSEGLYTWNRERFPGGKTGRGGSWCLCRNFGTELTSGLRLYTGAQGAPREDGPTDGGRPDRRIHVAVPFVCTTWL